MQATHGDYDENAHAGVVDASKELPKRVSEQHNLSDDKWAERIRNAWSGLSGASKCV